MKIKYVKGDVTAAEETIIAHGCNAQGVMGSGVAAIIRKKYTAAYDLYRKAFKDDGKLEMGRVYPEVVSGKVIANCITQEFYGTDKRYADYDAIKSVMRRLNTMGRNFTAGVLGAPRLENGNVAMPLIGAGLAGGDWEVISDIIETEFVDVTPVVYVFDKEHMYLLERNDV